MTDQLPTDPSCSVAAYVIRGPQGLLYLTASAIPQRLRPSALIMPQSGLWYPLNDFGLENWQAFVPPTLTSPPPPYIGSYAGISYFDVPVTNLTNGIYPLPNWLEPTFSGSAFTVQGVGADGSHGQPVRGGPNERLEPTRIRAK